MKKISAYVIVTFVCLMWSMPSQAQNAFIDSGTLWLTNNQNPDGSWGTQAQADLTFVYSTEAVNALKSLGSGVADYNEGITWLTSQDAISTDELSRIILSLVNAGVDSSVLINTLVNYKNSDGGWSYKNTPVSNPLDTALALQALKAANYPDTTLIGQSLNYLTTKQNADGGWGLSANDASNTYITSIVLRTLAAYNSVFINQNSINNAATFLLAKQAQNNDGGFGSSPSTVYDTALSLMSLIESGQGSMQQLQSAVTYLTSAQSSTNGSWNNDPYSTALALQALAKVRPNLAISSTGFSFSNTMPQIGEAVTITANVNNAGLDSASGIVVRFYSGDPASNGVQLGADQFISSLAPNSSTPVSITSSFTDTGNRTIFAVADPDNLISETSKADNKASARLWIATGPDLAVFSEDLNPSTYIPAAGTAFTLEYKVRNLGESSTDGFDVALYDGDPGAGGQVIDLPLQVIHISGLSGTEIRTGTFGVTLTGDGSHTLYLVADSGSLIPELSETNNTGTVTVTVGGTQTGADLVVTSADITLNPARPTTGQTVAISAKVRNQGADSAFGFLVELYDGSPESAGVLIASHTVSLAAGAEQTVTTNWTIPAGIHNVYAIADRINGIVESDESNNRASVRVMTDMVDISLSATDLVFTPSHPVNGDAVVLSITAHNTGINPTGPFNIALYDGDPSAGGTLVQTYAVNSIQGDGSTTVTYTFTASPQTYRFYAVADTESTVTEMYEENNLAIRSLKIKAANETLGPDLVPVKIDLSSMITNTQTLAVSGSAQVTFQNKGDAAITTSFNVILFEDKDNDGRYTAGVDNALGASTFVTGPTTTPSAIWPEGVGYVDVPLSGTVTFLHSPLYAFVDSGDVILEQDETNNMLVSCKDCEVVPTNPIQANVKWKWGIPSATWLMYAPPTIMHLRDTNNDEKIDQNDVPDIVLTTLNNAFTYQGKIWTFKGDTGENYFSRYDSNSPGVLDYISSGDIDGDGKPEIIFGAYGNGLLVYNSDWTLKWNNTAQVTAWQAAHPANAPGGYFIATISSQRNVTAIADLDGNGVPEIISGATVVNNDGSIRCGKNASTSGWGWFGTGTFGTNGVVYANFVSVADLNLDGQQEIIAGNAAYDKNCNTLWYKTSLPEGATAIANFDDDPYPEIVLVGGQSGGPVVYLLDHSGNTKWGPVSINQLLNYPYNVAVSQPVVADFDGDGKPEIGIRCMNKIIILNKDGQLKKMLTIPEYSNAGYYVTAPTVFDLNGDGIPEVMINSGGYFTVLNGKDGSTLFQDAFGGDTIITQSVLVADVDGDGQVELVVTGHDDKNFLEAMRVYHSADPNHPWTNGRRIWNQPAYHVTNINDDGSIPQHEAPGWLLNNSYLTQAAIGPNPNPYLTPNLTASMLRATQDSTGVNLIVRVGNGGAREALAGVPVTFYDGTSTGTVLGTALTTRVLQPGEYQDLILGVNSLADGLHHIYAVVNPCSSSSNCSNRISECNYDDNQASADITVVTGLPDPAVGAEDITLPSGPYYEGSLIPIMVSVKNLGAVSASNVTARLYNGNPTAGGTQLGLTQTISAISADGSVSATFAFDTLGKTGTNVLYIVLDMENSIIEASESNNVALVTLNVQTPTLPNFTITTDGIQTVPANPREGEQVTVTATVTNRGAAAGNVPVQISVRSLEPGVSSQELGTKTIYPILSLGQSAIVTATFDTAGLAGQRSIVVTIDPANLITESDKTDNSASKPIFIQSAGLTSSVLLDKAAYQANENMIATINLVNAAADTRSLVPTMAIKDSAGNLIATVSSGDAVTLGPNGTVTLTRTWNSGKNLAGNYSVTTEVAEGSVVISRANAGFTIMPDKSIESKVTTDKISYKPNETATITSTITSQSANYIQEHLSATMTIGLNSLNGSSGSNGTTYTETKTIATLMPGASFTFKSYWNAGISVPGTYPVTLEVKDAAGALIVSSTAAINLLSSSQTGAGITGAITVNQNPVYQGREETFSYNITNAGNEDLADLTPTIIIVDPETGEMKTEVGSLQTGVRRGETVANTQSISTSSLAPRTYLAVLLVKTEAMTTPKTLASALFEVKPGIEITKSIPDLVNLLVWVNDSNAECREQGAEGMEHEANDDDAEDFEECSRAVAPVRKCAGLDQIEQALTEAGVAYRIVTGKKEFQDELRNPIYTDFMILGDQNPVEDHIAEELREQVFAGKGLISSLFNRQSLDNEVFGITSAGSLPGRDYPVELAESGLGIQGTFQSYGKALKIKAADSAEVLATMTDHSGKTPVPYPAIVGHGFGKGKTLYFAFDLGISSSQTVFLGLLRQSLKFIHAPLDPAGLVPNQLVPVEIAIKSLGAAFDLQITESYPEGTKIYDPATRTWVADNPWVRTIELASHQTVTILYYAKTPDEPGVYAFLTAAGYREDGKYAPYQTVENEITVARSAGEALIEALSGLQALRLKKTEAAAREKAVRYLNTVMNRVVLTRSDREAVIADLRRSVSSVIKIRSVDISNTRYLIDSLLLFWEAEWYFSEP